MSAPMEPPPRARVLVVDDNPAIHEDFVKILAGDPSRPESLELAERMLFGVPSGSGSRLAPYALAHASQGQQAARAVERARSEGRPFALAFVDMRMPPGWDGLETIEQLWRIDPELQVVICSAHSDYDWNDVVERLGRSDKLLVLKKPFEPIEVLQCASALSRKWQQERALKAHVAALEQVVVARTETLEAANRQLRHLATHDAATGLPNRVLLDDRLAQAVAHAHRDRGTFAVLVADLDRFKLVNDSLGHSAGDAVLGEIARRLRGAVREVDTVARVGGDEFVIVLSPLAQEADAQGLAERVNEAVRAPIRVAGVDLRVACTIGVACFPADAASAEGLFARADAAMYFAKRRGRNHVQRFAAAMDTALPERIARESELHRALELEQFELHYQPKAETASGDVYSAEALIRWRHPERGLISPAQFIPLAEESGLIHDIGAWVLGEACRQGVKWQQSGLPPLRIAVNVAAAQFQRGDLLETVRRTLATTGFAARCLEVELTESAVMTHPEESAATLEELSRMGVLVSVDDFGTGYSSISYLRRFPIDRLKIDREFVKDMTNRPEDASIVRAIVSLAHSLRLKVVAEGVETPEQLSFLRSIGCDQYQGFHFSPALPAPQFAAKLREWQRLPDEGTDAEAARTHSKLAAYR
ncbi:MAG TPA: EAL domain-containing protein [Steroidobacteraceae bacterium]|nr:EAL domain-containing protein [Steroidobacteraceae bacterium]